MFNNRSILNRQLFINFQIKMSSIPFRNIRSILIYSQRIRYFQQPQRYAVTITDEYRPTTKSRSSLKGVELLRNPALNKVNKRKKKFENSIFFLLFRVWPLHLKNDSIWVYMVFYHPLFSHKIFKHFVWWLIFIEWIVKLSFRGVYIDTFVFNSIRWSRSL